MQYYLTSSLLSSLRRFELGDDQKSAYDAVVADGDGSFFITGPAGCGKTEVLRALKAIYPRAYVTAPTGAAASAVGGMTIHAALGWSKRGGWGSNGVKVRHSDSRSRCTHGQH